MPTKTADIITIGTLTAKDGVFAIADVDFIDEHWRNPATVQSEWFVDTKGPNAERLARSQGTYPVKQLSDGSWRVVIPNSDYAKVARQQISRLADSQGWTSDRVTARPKHASCMAVEDAARETNVGFAGKVLGLRAQAVTVQALVGADGKVTELRLKF